MSQIVEPLEEKALEYEELEDLIIRIDTLNNVYMEINKMHKHTIFRLKVTCSIFSVLNVALLIVLIVRGMA